MPTQKIDYLIVGAGIAGCVLAMTALQQGKKVLVIDQDEPHSASKAAAGIFNPITGVRIVKTWNADRLFPFLHQFYGELQQQLHTSFFFPSVIYRPFTSIESQNYGLARTATPTMQPYLQDSTQEARWSAYLHNPYGGIEVIQGGYVMADRLLASVQEHLQSQQAFVKATLHPKAVTFTDTGITWQHLQARYLICCNGWHAAQQDWWKWLPFAPVKGELLHLQTIHPPDVALPIVVGQGMYFFQQPNGNWVAGATYDKQNLNTLPTSKAREDLLNTLQTLVKLSVAVVGQNAGIRPAVKDRKPIIGKHPQHSALILFNGMGTKGISLAPYYAAQLLLHLEQNQPLDPEVNITRFYRHFKD